jgi:hypothetical protein
MQLLNVSIRMWLLRISLLPWFTCSYFRKSYCFESYCVSNDGCDSCSWNVYVYHCNYISYFTFASFMYITQYVSLCLIKKILSLQPRTRLCIRTSNLTLQHQVKDLAVIFDGLCNSTVHVYMESKKKWQVHCELWIVTDLVGNFVGLIESPVMQFPWRTRETTKMTSKIMYLWKIWTKYFWMQDKLSHLVEQHYILRHLKYVEHTHVQA